MNKKYSDSFSRCQVSVYRDQHKLETGFSYQALEVSSSE
ncbi:MAG: hypothetical protein ACJAS1_005454 [Oleiphilaceae bacterium]|jgi:hypothetical protein